MRVPVPTGSIVDLTIESERATSVEEINAAFREAAEHGAARSGSSPTPRMRSSARTSSARVLVDLRRGLTSVIDGTLVKVVAWYDNEWGYSSRLVDLAARVLVPVAHAVA